MKIFEKDGDTRVGIYNSRMKALAKTKAMTLSQFPPAKNYPRHVKSGTQAFTKLTSSSSVGQGNTAAGYCMLINIQHLMTSREVNMSTIQTKIISNVAFD